METYVWLGWFSIPHKEHYRVCKEFKKKGNLLVGLPRFFYKHQEVITRSRPLYGHERKRIFESLRINTFYFDFHSPYLQYFLTPVRIANQIIKEIPKKSIFLVREISHASAIYPLFKFSGFGFKFLKRSGIASTDIREKIYEEIIRKKKTNWEEDVIKETENLIREKWKRFEVLAYSPDYTWNFGLNNLFDFKIPLKGLI